ncbi:hypothetical protein KC19_1G106000 [Ceratodon purpureus]|uniref:TIR domain-containing protein n=1 Tax=Ceratodon purpureus TaxID=3225 RepID=A0A8T0J3L5_CERPU|nr:hypothetical protein KC19_1G106000 [Ceratodon purpureus]
MAMNDCEASTSGAVTENYDVFLNHRGPDVKATFVAHLEDALRCAGFRPFLDARSLMKGNPALKSIDQALDVAKVHVAVLSKRYAESKYCLNELVAMMRSGKPVIPVFYDVEPVDLRWVENGPFAEAFLKHKSKGRTQKKLQEWTDALGALAGITAFCSADYKRDEAKLKQEVVKEVARLTPSNDPVDVEPYRVGLQRRANACIQMADNMGAGTGILGLVGMGGVGKTTLAREIYNHFVAEKKFRNMTFLAIHRDSSTLDVEVGSTWVRELQKQLLWDLLRVQTSTSNDYSSWFRKVASVGPVLIVVDNVYKLNQFEVLVPFLSDLHPGSRIIVTSRDRSVYNNVAGRSKLEHCLYDVSTLDVEESNLLFNWHAFQADEAPEEFEGVAKEVVEGCGGLPLALKVIGSSLFDARWDDDSEAIWLEAVHALRQNPDVKGVLKWSYDHLSKPEKHMFLDIACLFCNRGVEEALVYWRSCEDCTSCGGVRYPQTALRNLKNKNLVSVVRVNCFLTTFKVHDLLIDLGQELGKKAKKHFVNGSVAEASIMMKQGTNKTLALSLVGSRKRKFEVEDFASMPNLHFLELPDGCVVNGDFRRISTKIRWLRWRGIVLDCIPLGLDVSCLTSLDFSRSTNLASLWTESQGNLKGFPNILSLNLSHCTSITKLPDCIGQSSHLGVLDLEGCYKLKMLPNSIGQLQELKTLRLESCRSLKGLPESIGQASGLHHVNLSECTKLKKLPESIGQLQLLQLLDVNLCTSLAAIPASIGALSNLEILYASCCTSLVKLPPSIGLCSSLRWLNVGASAECQTFSDGHIGEAWSRLRTLQLRKCGGFGSLLAYGAFKSLGTLTLEDSTVTELPESIGLLMGLTMLIIEACERLQCLPNSIGDLKGLEILRLTHCDNLKRLPKTLGGLTSLENLCIETCSIRKLPRSIGQLSGLRGLEIEGCKNLQKLPTSIRNLKGLRRFMLRDCGSVEAMGALTTLQGLPMWGTTSVTELPASLGLVSTLLAYGDVLDDDMDQFYRGVVGTSQVLEADESGFLKAYHDESSGVTRLVRVGVNQKQVSSAVLQVGV